MPSDLRECRQRALRCTELAERTTDPELKAVLKSLVERWLKLAADLEHAQASRDERAGRQRSDKAGSALARSQWSPSQRGR
jgi:hypothetical protein